MPNTTTTKKGKKRKRIEN